MEHLDNERSIYAQLTYASEFFYETKIKAEK